MSTTTDYCYLLTISRPSGCSQAVSSYVLCPGSVLLLSILGSSMLSCLCLQVELAGWLLALLCGFYSFHLHIVMFYVSYVARIYCLEFHKF